MTIALYLLTLLLAQQPVQPESGSISGQLRGGNGEVAPGIRIAAAPVEAGVPGAQSPVELSNIGQTDGEGRYRLENVRPGRYLIVAGSMASPSYYPTGTTPDKGRIVTVVAGQAVTNLNFAIEASIAMMIAGTARFDDNTPVTGEALRPSSFSLRFTRAGSNQAGSARLNAQQPGSLAFSGINAPGTYAVTVDPLPLGYYVQSITYGSTDLIRYPLVLEARLDNPIVDVVLSKKRPAGTPSGVKVSGRLIRNQNLDGTKLSRMITLLRLQNNFRPDTVPRPQDNFYVATAEVDTMDDGTFEIDGVPPGNYALEPGKVYELNPRIFSGTTFDVGGTDVHDLEVKIGQPEYPVTLTASKTSAVHGTVAIAEGAIPEFEIQFVPTREGEETRTVKISGREFSAMLPEGAYRVRISGLPAGYTLESVIAGPMDLTEPFLVTAAGIADRITGVRIKSDGIAVKLSR